MDGRTTPAPKTAVAAARGPDIRWVLLVYFAGGACALIDQVAWVRLLKLTLGNTVYASSVVVSTFMGGLALGAWLMGRRADRIERPLRLYAQLELLATATALAVPLALHVVDGGYRFIWANWQPPPAALLALQVVVSGVLLLVPAMVMGSTLPLLSRTVAASAARVGGTVGRLYALNTLGATLGCALAGFVLIRQVGVMGSLVVAAGLNLLVALAGWRLSLQGEMPPAPREEVAPQPVAGSPAIAMVLGASFVSGLVSLGYEMVWMRSVAIPLGGFTYVFSAVLTVYLLGNVLGAALGSRLVARVDRPAAAFGWSLVVLGLFGLLFVPWLAAWQQDLAPLLDDHWPADMARIIGRPLAWSLALVLLPSVAMGVGFPLALQAVAGARSRTGAVTGRLYALNTLGGVLGGALTGFVLVPLGGAQLTLTALGLLALVLGARLAVTGSRRLPVYGALLAGTLLALFVPRDLYLRTVLDRPQAVTLDVEEGTTSTVSVRRKPDGSLVLLSDGINIAGDDIHRVAQNMLGHLGVLLQGDAHDVLSVGFGSGETTFCLAQHDLRSIDCVEIAPELVRLALAHFQHINLGPALGQHVTMTYMDARNFLHVSPRRWDVIVNDADIPAFSGSAPLFTLEHFENAREHLLPGGLFVTKMHVGGMAMSRATFDSILGTFLQAFPHVTVWFPAMRPVSFFYLVGSPGPQVWPLEQLARDVRVPGVAKGLSVMGVGDEYDLLSCYVGDQDDARRYLRDWQLNTDDHPFVEFNTDVEEMDEQAMHPLFHEFIEALSSDSLRAHLDTAGMSETEREAAWSRLAIARAAALQVVRATGAGNNLARLQALEEGLHAAPTHAALLDLLDQALQGIDRLPPGGGGAAVLGAVEQQLARSPQAALPHLVRARLLAARGSLPEALADAELAVAAAPRNPRAQDQLGTLLLKLDRPAEALTCFDAALALTPKLTGLRGRRAAALSALGRHKEALDDARLEAELSPTDAVVQRELGQLLVAAGQVEEALPHYRLAVQWDPDAPTAQRELAWLLATHPDPAVRAPAEAITLAERACELTQRRAWKALDALAAAYAAGGRFPEAVQTVQAAITQARAASPEELQALRQRQQLYAEGKPFLVTSR